MGEYWTGAGAVDPTVKRAMEIAPFFRNNRVTRLIYLLTAYMLINKSDLFQVPE